MCMTVYFHTHSPITLLWLFTVPTERQVLCNSTVSAHLYDKSECVSLHPPHWHLRIHQTLPYTILQNKLNRYSYTAWSFNSHCLAQLCELPYSAWYKCSPRTNCWLCNDCKKKPVTKSLGLALSWLLSFQFPHSQCPFPAFPTHAEYALPQTGLLLIKWQSVWITTVLPKDGFFFTY